MESLQKEIAELKRQITLLESEKKAHGAAKNINDSLAAEVPEELKALFSEAQQNVSAYFSTLKMDPSKGCIEIKDERYVLVRASAFSKSFLETIRHLYSDKGDKEAFAIGKNFLFDYAHVIGMDDARNFHRKMKLTEPVSRLSAGPIHFAFSGWAFVEIDAASNVTSQDEFCIIFRHPYSFEADSWIRDGKRSDEPVCIMNAGYASGWCQESFGIALTTVEIKCAAKGDDCCQFIMAPPDRIHEELAKYQQRESSVQTLQHPIAVPTLFERKKVEEELERSRQMAEDSARAKADFIANISHELRTPLGSILGFAALLRKTTLDEQQRDYLQAILSSGRNLLGIINNVLDLSRLDAGSFPIEKVPFDVRHTMRSVQLMLMSQATEKGLALVCEIDEKILFALEGDPLRLTQILTNLAGNAIKFTYTGRVALSCELLEDAGQQVSLKFIVEDTGIGIAEDKIDQIFERFTQADSQITRRFGGTGLGLAITRQLVDLLNGSIKVHSSANGTRFECVIPYQKSNVPPALLHQPDPVDITDTQKYSASILIVDDQLLNRKLATIILEQRGFDTAAVQNGAEAISLLKDRKFDLILLDLQMPDMDGYETVRQIREILRLNTPVIAITAHALSGEKEQCLSLGMNDYLSKPYSENSLIEKIMPLLSFEKPEAKQVVCIDSSYLLKQTGNKAVVEEMIKTFLEQLPVELAVLRDAIEQEDRPAVFHAAHVLRNSTGLFGLQQTIGLTLLQIEKMARADHDLGEIRLLFYEVDKACKMILENSSNQIC